MSEETTQPKKRKWKVNWTSEKVMSSSALFISVISLIALIYQSYLAREDNKLTQKQQSASVLPYLNQWQSNYNNHFQLILGNKGVGPAFIKKVKLTLNNSKTFNNSDDLFNEIFNSSKEIDTIPKVTSALVNGFVLPANEYISLIEINGKRNIEMFLKVLETKNISYEITYEDVYGTQWIINNNEEDKNKASVPTLILKE